MRFSLILSVLISMGVGLSGPVTSQSSAPIITYNTQFHPTLARKGMVVSQDVHASNAGQEILALGGNAVDAAVATGFALAVTHPQAGNLGGGGFMLVYLRSEDRTIAIDYREMAPAAATRDMFLREDGSVDNQAVSFSYKSSGVPGTVMGLTEALAKYGTLPLATVMEPAIRLAEDGFPVTWALAGSLSRYKERLSADETSRKQFFKEDGSDYQAGELLVQADLAKTLKEIAAKGADGFYEGWVADRIVETMESDGGLITHDDLKNYVVKERQAIEGTYRNYRVVSMPPPSSGGVHLIQMLNVLEGWDMKGLGHNSADYIHRLTESMKYAYADRSKYLGDPDYVNVPAKALTSKDYAKTIRDRIKLDKATPSKDIAPAPDLPDESKDTTHFSTVDAAGNMVTNTYTLNYTYGSGRSVAGAGFLLNNEMDDFSAKPGSPNGYGLVGGEANAIAAGKRPLSSMTPVLLFKDGEPFMVTGSPGGSTIITVVLQTVLNVMEFDMNAATATARPRIHHQWYPDRLAIEPGVTADTLRKLIDMGHPVLTDRPRILGATMTIIRRPDGVIAGSADPRRPGAHAAPY